MQPRRSSRGRRSGVSGSRISQEVGQEPRIGWSNRELQNVECSTTADVTYHFLHLPYSHLAVGWLKSGLSRANRFLLTISDSVNTTKMAATRAAGAAYAGQHKGSIERMLKMLCAAPSTGPE